MEIFEKVAIVTKLQKISKDVFKEVVSSLEVGVSEMDIAQFLRKSFEKRGITEFWYTVPEVVLIGSERFKLGTTTTDYSIKSPQKDSILQEGSPFYVDLAPMDPKTKTWGDWNGMIVFRPKMGTDDEQVAFLQEIRKIQLDGISDITASTAGAEIVKWYLDEFKKHDIELLDVRNNIGHSIHSGPKDKAKRIWLDLNNTSPLGEGIFTIEPGGARGNLVGRFEECIYIPAEGTAKIL